MRISDWSSDVCSSDLRYCRIGSIGEHVGDAPIIAAAREAGLADIARHQLEGNTRVLLELAQTFVGSVGLLVGEENRSDAADHDQAEYQRNHQLDQAEAGLAGSRSRSRSERVAVSSPSRSEEHTP